MAKITKIERPDGSKGYHIQIYVNGQRPSGTFDTKKEATDWADATATELRLQKSTGINRSKTIAHAFDRYAREVSPTKAGCRFEQVRLHALARIEIGPKQTPLGTIRLCDMDASHMAALRDKRLETVTGATVNREFNLLSHVFSTARREWKWITASPTSDVSRPKATRPRVRRITDDEIARVCHALGFVEGSIAAQASQRVAIAFLFAIETAMRAGEICKIERVKPKDPVVRDNLGRVIYEKSWLESKHVHLGKTKNGDARDVPLTARAVQLIKMLPVTGPLLFGFKQAAESTDDDGLGRKPANPIDALFRKARDRAAVVDLHFHDTRHEAITRLVRIYTDVVTLARIVGHRNLNQLLDYFNPTIDELVAKLNA